MSRNLLKSSCCGNIVRLSDLRGQPIEFRRYGSEPVALGTKWVCPSCKTTYFAWWNNATWQGGYDESTPKFAIDLSYYDTFNDESALEPVDEPLHLCLSNAEDNQNVLGNPQQTRTPWWRLLQLASVFNWGFSSINGFN